jgi:transcriptional regulator with XRE-family HTH domain
MTPFGARIRDLRAARGLTQKQFAERLGVSSAYLSALEHGRRGRPTFALVQGMIQVLGAIWDDADDLIRLADLSDPRVTIDTGGLDPAATLLANRLSRQIGDLEAGEVAAISAVLDGAQARARAGSKTGS